VEKKIEVWLPVVGYEGLYDVSDLGMIRSVRRNNKLLKRYICKSGYYEVGLTVNNKVRTLRVHRLVAKAHIENPHNFQVVNHKDGNKLNSAKSNLEWCTSSYNVKHAYAIGLSNPFCPKRLKRLSDASIALCKPVLVTDVINNTIFNFPSIKKAAEFIGISHSGVSHGIKHGRRLMNNYTASYAIDKPSLPTTVK